MTPNPKNPPELTVDDLPLDRINIQDPTNHPELTVDDLPLDRIIKIQTLEEAAAEENNSLNNELQHYKNPELALNPPLHSELSSDVSSTKPYFDLNNLCRPISTSRKEIEAFFLYINGEHSLESKNRTPQMQQEDQALWEAFHKEWPIIDKEMKGAGLKYLSAENVIKHMNFRQYWEFRNYQIQTMNGSIEQGKIFLERLRLSIKTEHLDPHISIKELLNQPNSNLLEIFQLNKNLIDQIKGEDLTVEDVINYLKNMHNLYQGITVAPNGDNNQAYIQYKENDNDETPPKTLITIQHDQSKQHHFNFKISGNLTEQELNKAIPLMIDQVHRSKEITNTHGIEIYGFLKNPKKALEIFMLLMKNGLYSITIETATLKAWEEAAKDLTNVNRTAFQEALAIYNGDTNNPGLYPLACVCQKEHSESEVKQNWQTVQNYWTQTQQLKFREQPKKDSKEEHQQETKKRPIEATKERPAEEIKEQLPKKRPRN